MQSYTISEDKFTLCYSSLGTYSRYFTLLTAWKILIKNLNLNTICVMKEKNIFEMLGEKKESTRPLSFLSFEDLVQVQVSCCCKYYKLIHEYPFPIQSTSCWWGIPWLISPVLMDSVRFEKASPEICYWIISWCTVERVNAMRDSFC